MCRQAGEVLCHVPASALLTINTVPDDFKRLHQGISVHGLLASFLAFGVPDPSFYSPWKNSWPSMKDLEESMPILWPNSMREPVHNDGYPHHTVGQGQNSSFVLPPAIAGRWAHHQMREFWMIRATAPLVRVFGLHDFSLESHETRSGTNHPIDIFQGSPQIANTDFEI